MIASYRIPLAALSLTIALLVARSGEAATAKKPRAMKGLEAATRLQVFLDGAGFAPGKIDGHYGEFTVKALAGVPVSIH